jgi:hypothetical protein
MSMLIAGLAGVGFVSCANAAGADRAATVSAAKRIERFIAASPVKLNKPALLMLDY